MAGIAMKYNLDGPGQPTPVNSEVHKLGRGGVNDDIVAKVYHPHSPLFWIGALALATFGLAAVSGSGSVRVGPVHASAAAGAGK